MRTRIIGATASSRGCACASGLIEFASLSQRVSLDFQWVFLLLSSIRAAPSERAPLRFVSAASLFDGHDAAINIIRRLLQAHGAEVVHLGHNRSVADIVRAAIQEDADGIAVSSYQGGHNEYFRYMVDMLRDPGREHIRVVVGRRRHDRARRDRGARSLRRREDLHARRRPPHGPRRHDRGRVPTRVRAARKPRYEFRPVRCRAITGRSRSDDLGARGIGAMRGALARHHPARARARANVVRRSSASPAPAAPASRSSTDELLNRVRAPFPGSPDRRRRHGSDAAPLGRRAARRSHPHELRCANEQHLHALARDASPAPRDQRGARGRHRSCSSSRAST